MVSWVISLDILVEVTTEREKTIEGAKIRWRGESNRASRRVEWERVGDGGGKRRLLLALQAKLQGGVKIFDAHRRVGAAKTCDVPAMVVVGQRRPCKCQPPVSASECCTVACKFTYCWPSSQLPAACRGGGPRSTGQISSGASLEDGLDGPCTQAWPMRTWREATDDLAPVTAQQLAGSGAMLVLCRAAGLQIRAWPLSGFFRSW